MALNLSKDQRSVLDREYAEIEDITREEIERRLPIGRGSMRLALSMYRTPREQKERAARAAKEVLPGFDKNGRPKRKRK